MAGSRRCGHGRRDRAHASARGQGRAASGCPVAPVRRRRADRLNRAWRATLRSSPRSPRLRSRGCARSIDASPAGRRPSRRVSCQAASTERSEPIGPETWACVDGGVAPRGGEAAAGERLLPSSSRSTPRGGDRLPTGAARKAGRPRPRSTHERCRESENDAQFRDSRRSIPRRNSPGRLRLCEQQFSLEQTGRIAARDPPPRFYQV